jgi:hypothetical protein
MKKKQKRLSAKQKTALLDVLAELEKKFPGDRDAQSEWLVKFVESEASVSGPL